MGQFMPSEIARLVLGYLRETGCVRTCSVYLNESPHLVEYSSCLKQGYEYPTSIGGASLIEMLLQLCTFKGSVDKNRTQLNLNGNRELELRPNNLSTVVVVPAYTSRATSPVLQSLSLSQVASPVRQDHTCLFISTATSPIQPNLSSPDVVRVPDDGLSFVSTAASTLPSDFQKNSNNSNRFVSADTSPIEQLDRYGGDIEIVSDDIPTIRIEEERTSSTLLGECSSSSNVVTNNSTSETLHYDFCSKIQSTPTTRPTCVYSSPGSIARSALAFSFGLEALQTPVKHIDDSNWKSPRRKNQVTRKRLTYSMPSSSTKNKNQSIYDGSTTMTPSKANDTVVQKKEDGVDVSEIIGELLNNTALHECIAANINRVVCNVDDGTNDDHSFNNCSSNVTTAGREKETVVVAEKTTSVAVTTSNVQSNFDSTKTNEHFVPDNVVKDIVNRTESDPLFEAFIKIFFDKQEENSPTSQQSDIHVQQDTDVISASPLVSMEHEVPCTVESTVATIGVSPPQTTTTTIITTTTTTTTTTAAPCSPESVMNLSGFIDHPFMSNPAGNGPQIVVNDLELESSLVIDNDAGPGLTSTMTFTVLEPIKTVHLPQFQTVQFTTISPSESQRLLSLSNGREIPSQLTRTSMESVATLNSHGNQNKRPPLKHPKIGIKKPLKSLISTEDKNENQSMLINTSGVKNRRKPSKLFDNICAKQLNFTVNSKIANSKVSPLKSRDLTITKVSNESRSPKLLSLLTQSTEALRSRCVDAQSPSTITDSHVVRVLNFSSGSDLNKNMTLESNGDGILVSSRKSQSTLNNDQRQSNKGESDEGAQFATNGKRKLLDACGNRKRKRTDGSNGINYLSKMDVEKFLSTVKYV